MPKISVVIPVYRNSNTLSELCQRILLSVESICCECEIILVNDSCPANSWETIESIIEKSSQVRGVNLSRNFGQHIAIAAGIDRATGDWLVVMDGDLQDEPEEIPRLYAAATSNHYDLVLAQRTNRKDRFLKRFSSKLFSIAYKLMVGTALDHSVGNFGIYSRGVYKNLQGFHEQHRFFPTDIQWLGFCQGNLEVKHNIREDGKSSYSLIKLLRLTFMTITTRTNRPLVFSIIAGAITSLCSLFYGAVILFNAVFNNSYQVTGWVSLIVSIFFLSGTILLSIGILGIYLGHIFTEAKARPIYVVKNEI